MKSTRLLLTNLLILLSLTVCLSKHPVSIRSTLRSSFAADSIISKLAQENRELLMKYEALSREMADVRKEVDKNTTYNAEINTTADRVISWSGYILTIGSIVLAIIGAYTIFEVKEIRKLKKECEGLVKDAKSKVTNQLNEFAESLKRLDADKEKSLRLLFPLIEGQINFTNGSYERALELFKEADSIEPDHPRIIKPLYWLYTNTGRIDDAITKLEVLHKQEPNNKITATRLAEAYRRNKEYDKAADVVRKFAIGCKYPPSMYELAAIMQAKKKYLEAETYYVLARELYKLESKEERHWVNLSIALMQFVNGKQVESLVSAKQTVLICGDTLVRKPNNSHCLLSLSIAQILENANNSVADNNLHMALANGLPLGLAESATEKIALIETTKSTEITSKMRTTLQDYLKKPIGVQNIA